MQTLYSEPLPATLDVRTAGLRGTVVRGFLALGNLPRFCESLASERGRAEISCSFFRDDESRSIVVVQVRADVQVVCQRCLDIMTVMVASESELAIVADDDQARLLPRRLGPLIVEGEECNLWELAEDELILSLPIVSYHDGVSCRKLPDYPNSDERELAQAENPFKVLEQLKSIQVKQEPGDGSTEK
ncbi:MAG: YceD family protein [Halieaceae bacterium]|nr:YceD family protein [Halieaceae bacterium]